MFLKIEIFLKKLSVNCVDAQGRVYCTLQGHDIVSSSSSDADDYESFDVDQEQALEAQASTHDASSSSEMP